MEGTHNRKLWPLEPEDATQRRVQGLCVACESTIILVEDPESELVIATLYRERSACYDAKKHRCASLADDLLAKAVVMEQVL